MGGALQSRRRHGRRHHLYGALWSTLALSLAGCAIWAAPEDYQAYRRIRLADDEPRRLLAMRRYLDDQPEGDWHEEIEAHLAAKETEIYQRGASDAEGLALYLRVYPEGSFAAQARAKLEALERVAKARGEAQTQGAEIEAEQRREAAERRRTWVGRFSAYWLEQLLGIDRYGTPIGEMARAHESFATSFGLTPAPRCDKAACVKRYHHAFAIPVPGGTRVERRIDLVVRLRLDEGRVTQAEILWPERGFSRWYELEQQVEVIDSDPQSRAAAVAWAAEKIQTMLEGSGLKLEPFEGAPPSALPPLALAGEAEPVDASLMSPADAPPPSEANRQQAPAPPDASPQAAPSASEAAGDPGSDGRERREAETKSESGEGRRTRDAQAPPEGRAEAAAPNEGGELMILAPLAVGKGAAEASAADAETAAPESAGGASAAGRGAAGEAREAGEASGPREVLVDRVGAGKRVVVFAARPGAPQAYDGLLITSRP